MTGYELTLQTTSRVDRRLDGDLAVWFFILAELLAFGVFFIAYAFARATHVGAFAEGQAALNRTVGMVNTVLLLTASACVVRAVRSAAEGLKNGAGGWLLLAIACGFGFIVLKGREYVHAFAAGVTLSSSTFHMFYLSLTFFHFMHVILGVVVLMLLWLGLRQGRYGPGETNSLESGAAYWHMVDLVWLILFPLVYVIH